MPYSDYTREEVAKRGEEIYAREIKERVEPHEKGKFVIIDIETGDYEIDASDLAGHQARPRQTTRSRFVPYPHRLPSGHQTRRPIHYEQAVISGVVTAHGEAIIRLEILGPNGGREEIETVLDT